jgi:hypothetical protein
MNATLLLFMELFLNYPELASKIYNLKNQFYLKKFVPLVLKKIFYLNWKIFQLSLFCPRTIVDGFGIFTNQFISTQTDAVTPEPQVNIRGLLSVFRILTNSSFGKNLLFRVLGVWHIYGAGNMACNRPSLLPISLNRFSARASIRTESLVCVFSKIVLAFFD